MSLRVPRLTTGLVLTLAVLWGSAAYAANPATINVTVTIQNLSVSTSGPIAFGVVVASSTTVNATASTVTNDGNVAETYDLKLTDPGGWTAVVAAPGAEEYCLSAQFNSTEPTAVSFDGDHDLSTSDQTSSATIFAGDETGLSVAASATRSLWLKFEAPTSTAVTSEQTIVVTVTAAAA
jgi:hypothetical protein